MIHNPVHPSDREPYVLRVYLDCHFQRTFQVNSENALLEDQVQRDH